MARPAFIPVPKKAETETVTVAPVVEIPEVETTAAPVFETPAAPVVEAAPVAEAPAVVEEAPKKKSRAKVSGEVRKTPNRQMTPEDIEFVVANIKTMSYSEIDKARSITKAQINRVLTETKKQLRDACSDNAEALATVEKYIADNLSRPEDSRPGVPGGKRPSVVKSSIEDIVGNIINSINK